MGADDTKLSCTQLQYRINVSTKFQYNGSKTAGGVHVTKLPDRWTDIQADSRIPTQTLVLWGFEDGMVNYNLER